jgi:putative transposase
MALGRPVTPIVLTPPVRAELEGMLRSRALPHTLVRRARVILLAADGQYNTVIAARVGLSGAMVGFWRKRFLAQGLVGLYDEPRPGGPRSISDERVTVLIRRTLNTKPKDRTHWTCHR